MQEMACLFSSYIKANDKYVTLQSLFSNVYTGLSLKEMACLFRSLLVYKFYIRWNDVECTCYI